MPDSESGADGWLAVTVTAVRAYADEVESFLLGAGAISVTVEDAGNELLVDEFEPQQSPAWARQRITGLFDGDADGVAIANAACLLLDIERDGVGVRHIDDRNWERESLERFRPFRVGRRLWVCPSWCEPVDPDTVNVMLDPGLAFGTGSHATTALCLQAVEEIAPAGLDLIDYGCGSGIVAIAGLLLGARHATGIDIDPRAVRTSRENAVRNGVGERFIAILAVDSEPQPADVVIANILSHTVIGLAPTLTGLVRDGGRLILSGILPAQVGRVAAAYPEFRFDQRLREGWAALVGRRI